MATNRNCYHAGKCMLLTECSTLTVAYCIESIFIAQNKYVEVVGKNVFYKEVEFDDLNSFIELYSLNVLADTTLHPMCDIDDGEYVFEDSKTLAAAHFNGDNGMALQFVNAMAIQCWPVKLLVTDAHIKIQPEQIIDLYKQPYCII